ncbi:MAG TPA: hypothetical protein K8V56_09775 [Sporosarcina psychrophila]|uniref:Uncharacterized protein n=1 Tax=Sporosarcina psychrophila TaxID=1476 RepID=A0A921KCS4_SPOPS|nr:hypothetical protein [Sporosarcina psychrophila]
MITSLSLTAWTDDYRRQTQTQIKTSGERWLLSPQKEDRRLNGKIA